MSQVVLDRVSKSFPALGRAEVRALQAASLNARAGELTAVLGPSGSGKTTLLRIIAGLEQPDSGALFLGGKDALPLPAKDRGVAMVFQQPALYPHFTARENLALGLRLRKVPAREIRQRIGETAELLGIGDCLDRLPQNLSGGQRQRVALGRAIVRRPQVYLLDEPLSQLDTPMRSQLRGDLRRIQQELGATMIFVTHDQADALAIADRVAVIIGGEVFQCDEPSVVYNAPACLAVAGFIGSPPMNLLPVILVGQGERPALEWGNAAGPLHLVLPESGLSAEVLNQMGQEIILGIRPEHVSVVTDLAPAASSVTARIARAEFFGADLLLRLSIGSVTLVARVPAGANLAAGQQVRVSIPLSKALCYRKSGGLLVPPP